MKYVITKQTKRGLEIGQNEYAKDEAIAKASRLNKMGMNVKVMSVEEVYGQ